MKFLAEIDGASKLKQDASNRLVSDTEKETWNGKQNALTFDSTPKASSTNPVTSEGIKTALDGKVDNNQVLTNVPSDAIFTDTITTINGKTGAITKADIVALGIPSQDTNTTYSEITTSEIDAGTSSTLRTITGRRVKYLLDKVQGWINALTKSDIGLGDVENYSIATQSEAESGTANNRYMTPLRTKQAINTHNIYESSHQDIRQQINSLDADVVAHKAEKASQGEVHGFRVNEDKALEFFNGEEWVGVQSGIGSIVVDITNSPGNKVGIGTMEEGFFGEVPASELITGDALASECGISQGTSQHSTAGWLKFAYKGEIQFVAKKPIRHSISWDAINTANCVYGGSEDRTVVIGGLTYRVRLMRALEPTNDPKTTVSATSGVINHYSEWNRLMCQIHEQAIGGSWDYPNNIENDIGLLEHNLGNGTQGMYNDTDLGVKSGNGRFSWCQEMSTSASLRLHRGSTGVSHSNSNTSSNTTSIYGWRPVLRLVEED